MLATAEKSTRRSLPRRSVFTDQQIESVAKWDSASIAQWTSSVAHERGIRIRKRPNERFVRAVSRLSDGVENLDPVEQLLVELRLAGVISPFQRGMLQIQYLR